MTSVPSRRYIKIPVKLWNEAKHSPVYSQLTEELEDRIALEQAKKVKGRKITLNAYLKKRFE